MFIPIYIKTYEEGLLSEKIEQAWSILEECSLCPRNCRVNRLKGEKGVCKGGFLPMVSSYNPHFGEESPLVGEHGSGTIFLTHCNLRCIFCQNYSISHEGEGREITFERLAEMMIELQELGCHNINFVTPTHYVPQILKALEIAIKKGLRVPLVYNTGAYDSLETIKILNGIIDIYMPDFKYADSEVAKKYSHAPDYPEVAKKAIKEMHNQVGDLVINEKGIAERGLLIRHLVLPNGLAGTEKIMKFIAEEISKNTYVNIMDQYYPCGEVYSDLYLNRRITPEEYNEAIEYAKKEGIHRLDKREKRIIWWI
ncbi:radical SAM protein [SCandidatus Aminicenantes bacterium Aminicenantia_JdfR_composite]|jgi:putative pyruvate formate lyase activating enzyme|nr:radical SAM protein [SCandidatus Aminicenantes bacterium Aminicenantia_JdfR_composite]MCP2596593.1 radical SAM protein [Candidatus Aminicenantes bacterium AC-335-G13]MCP2598192.1 radical SAM protein [Candidatus Aminicenantes bacterium AC-335-L06]